MEISGRPEVGASLLDRLRFLTALCLVALGAAAFAIAFRSSLVLWDRTVPGARDVVDAFGRLPWWMRAGLPALGGAAAGLIAQLRATPTPGVGNVLEAVALGDGRPTNGPGRDVPSVVNLDDLVGREVLVAGTIKENMDLPRANADRDPVQVK